MASPDYNYMMNTTEEKSQTEQKMLLSLQKTQFHQERNCSVAETESLRFGSSDADPI